MDPAIITLCVLAVAAFLFVTELIPLAVTAMAACTDHGDGTADVSSDSQWHQFLGSRDFSCLADADDNWHQASYGTSVGRYGGQYDGDEHDSCHERNLIRSCLLDDGYADCFGKACLEHSRADDEHAAEEYDCGV